MTGSLGDGCSFQLGMKLMAHTTVPSPAIEADVRIINSAEALKIKSALQQYTHTYTQAHTRMHTGTVTAEQSSQ